MASSALEGVPGTRHAEFSGAANLHLRKYILILCHSVSPYLTTPRSAV